MVFMVFFLVCGLYYGGFGLGDEQLLALVVVDGEVGDVLVVVDLGFA